MFELEQQSIENQIRAYCSAQRVPFADLQWKPTPSAGGWGIATSFFQLAANEARAGKKINVPQRAQEIAEQNYLPCIYLVDSGGIFLVLTETGPRTGITRRISICEAGMASPTTFVRSLVLTRTFSSPARAYMAKENGSYWPCAANASNLATRSKAAGTVS